LRDLQMAYNTATKKLQTYTKEK